MFKKFITLSLLISIFSIASSINVFAQAKLSDETKTVSQNNETKSDNLREVLLKKENKTAVSFDDKDNLANHQKQKSQGKRFSTGTKILIGVGIAAAAMGVLVFAASRDKIRTF